MKEEIEKTPTKQYSSVWIIHESKLNLTFLNSHQMQPKLRKQHK